MTIKLNTIFYNYYAKINITNRILTLFLYLLKNPEFIRLIISFIDTLKFKTNYVKDKIYLCRKSSTKELKKYLIEITNYVIINVKKLLPTSFCSYPKVAISEHFTVNQARTLIDAQSLI